jgi:hypothetical protein
MRPSYAYGVYQAANLASRLNLPAISVMEFGVAGGRGLIALERIAATLAQRFGIRISVYGFDTGEGMPAPRDYRDVPFIWGAGFYKMDPQRLKAQLRSAQLVLGDIRTTAPALLEKGGLDPIGFVAFDLDYYSSTRDAFQIFGGGSDTRMPRIYTYLDDIIWPETACHNPYIGVLCAVREFNETHENQKLCPIHMLNHMLPHPAAWHEQIYVLHDFQHPLYPVNITPAAAAQTQLPL